MFGSAHVTAQLNIPVGFSAPAHRVCAISRGSLFSGQVASDAAVSPIGCNIQTG
jgi:hypothetical protein